MFDICLKNDVPLNITEVAINKFSESLRRFDYANAKKYFVKIFKVINDDLNPSTVNCLKIFMKIIKEIDFIKSFYDEQATNDEEDQGFLNISTAIEYYLNENELEEKLF